MELNIAKIELLGELNEEENTDFRIFLKQQDPDKVDKIVHRINKEVTSRIDCQECGNCCIHMKPSVTESEIERLSQIKGLTNSEFTSKFVESDDFDDMQFLKDSPCIFLKGKSCSIYNDRPEDCRSYPHTHKPEFTTRTIEMIHNYSQCPIVFHVLERLKRELNYR